MNAIGNLFRRLLFGRVEPHVDQPNKRSSLTVYGDEKHAKKWHDLFNQVVEKAKKVKPDEIKRLLDG